MKTCKKVYFWTKDTFLINVFQKLKRKAEKFGVVALTVNGGQGHFCPDFSKNK